MPSLSIALCIVARNEASMIEGAIASARPVVDEVVVVDTGSSDATAELARRSGARVFAHDWPGDLARAHALPVAHAESDWVLALDADEVLDPATRGALRDCAAAGERDGYRLPVRNYTYQWSRKWRPADPADALSRGAAGYWPTNPVRLFRRRPQHTYSGFVHQSVAPAISAAGGTIGDLDVAIHHYGFLRFDRHKSDLYGTLLRREVRAVPDAPQAWVDLAVALLDEGRVPSAAAALRQARALGDGAAAPFLLGALLCQSGCAEAAVPLLEQAIGGNGDDACPYYDRADAWEELGLAHEQLGSPVLAQQAYRHALRARPGSPVAAANLAALLVDCGASSEAEALLGPLLAGHPYAASAWTTLGVLRLRRRDLAGARRALETALDIRPAHLAALVNLARVHARAGHPRLSARAYRAAAENLDSAEARALALERHVPARYVPRPSPLTRRPPPRLVASLIGTLAGGAGRVLVDAVRALDGRPHVVLCGDTGGKPGRGLRRELAASNVEVLTVGEDVRAALTRLRPSVVLHHWWRQQVAPGAVRVGDERWICVGHAPLPMPFGYDGYVVVARFHAHLQCHLPSDRVFAVPNGVDLARFRQGAGDHRRRARVTIVMLSRLDQGKFPRRLLAYLPQLRGAQVLIAGSGPRRHELEPEIRARGLERHVRFLGPVDSTAVPRLLAGADIGLHLTELHEELCSMAVLEMLAAGLPVVAEPKGGLPELVTHGENGFLASDPADVAHHLAQLIAAPALRRSMGEAARRRVRSFALERFDTAWRRLVDDTERREPLRSPLARPHAVAASPLAAQDLPTLSYLVCATARSGSSFLCDLLTATGVAGEPGEHFSADWMRTVGGAWNSTDFGEYLARLFLTTATPNGVFGTKVLPEAFEELLAGLESLPGARGPAPAALIASTMGDVRYVRLTRRDRLRQAISLERAVQTALWARRGPPAPSVAPPRPRYDRAAIARRLDQLGRQEGRWDAFFATVRAPCAHVVYEELAADPEGTTARVLRELGVGVPAGPWCGGPKVRQQADELTEQWVARFEREERQAASATRRRRTSAATTPTS